MKSLFLILIVLALLGCLGYFYYHWKIVQNEREVSSYADAPYTNDLGKTLIIYYSLKGHTQAIAETIASLTNGEVYRIETVKPIDTGRWFPMHVLKQLILNQHPAIKPGLPDLTKYDTIFVGGPVWWCMPATPLLTFLNKTDFNAKPVVPFATQGGTSGWFFDKVKSEIYNASLRRGEAFNAVGPQYADATKFKIIHWLNALPGIKSKD